MKLDVRILNASLFALMLAACDGGPSLPRVSGIDGAVRFTYSGARNGTYSAAGAADGFSPSYAYADRSSDGWTAVYTTWARQDGSRISLTIAFPTPSGPTTVGFDWRKCLQDGPCPGGTVFFVPPQAPFAAGDRARDVAQDVFSYARGTIRITSVTAGRIRGTFSGSGNSQAVTTDELSLSDGAFDVPIVSQ